MLGTVAIVGPGLIGGSIALGIKKKMLASCVVGIGHQKSSIEKAIQLKAVDACTLDIAEGVQTADIVILATPVNLIVELARKAIPHMKESAVLTDVGSAKSRIVTEIGKIPREGRFFVGGHPMAGSEHRGLEWASADLFEGARCILTPDGSSNKDAVEKVASMWKSLGAVVKFLSPEEHDEIVAYVSHLPHLIASSLANVVEEGYWQYAARGLKDTTRIASSDADLWLSIYEQNRTELIKSIDAFLEKIIALRKALSNKNDKDDKKILEILKEGKRIRDAYLAKLGE